MIDHGADAGRYARRALTHVGYLAHEIGGRGSCTAAERQAAEYGADQMRAVGIREVRLEPFRGAASAYNRYALAVGVALLGLAVALAGQGRAAALLAAGLCGLGAWGLWAESDFWPNWTRWVIPGRPSQNVVGRAPAQGTAARTAVLVAHIDSHRTPVFNSTRAWQRLYKAGFQGLLGCLIAGAAISLLAAASGATGLRWLMIPPGLPLLAGLVLFLQADRTPFSPGAYDNASGAGSVLALGERLIQEPLTGTSVWLALTGCEETGADGMAALLQSHRSDWQDAVIINLDQMGLGRLYLRLCEGLIVPHRPDARALALAHQVQQALPNLEVRERASQGFSDAAVAHKLGFSAISIGTGPVSADVPIHRHQATDTVEFVELEALHDTQIFVWELLRAID